MGSSSAYVFVSYASVDRPEVLRVVTALRDAGLNAWIDQQDITGGMQYGSEIGDGIRGCTAFVLMCSPASLASRNVRQEIMLAWKYGRPYLPLLLDVITIPPDLEYWLEGAQWIEVLDHPEELWLPRILAAVERFEQDQLQPGGSVADSLKAGTTIRTNLPPASPLVGRSAEIDAILQLIAPDAGRLVTLTGSGGVGKTRLATAAATRYATAVNRVIFVPLDSVSGAELVPPLIARAAGTQIEDGQTWVEQLSSTFAGQRTLLVLDNLEHLAGVAEIVDQILNHCPGVIVLATSRVRLGLYSEQEYPVPPLALPNLARLPEVAELARVDAVDLFVRRARLLRPEFRLTEENAQAVAGLCVRLDGLPLAIELAAARVKLFTPQAMLQRMETALPLLTGGARNLPERQQTLRNTIAWSNDLLSLTEQRLYRRMSVFRGDWTLDAAEAVAGHRDGDALNLDVMTGLEQLVEHSILRQSDAGDDVRFSMLETIREFGLERLNDAGEATDAGQRHAQHFISFIEELRQRARQGASDSSVRLEREYDNVRAAIRHCLVHDHLLALRYCEHLTGFWDHSGNVDEALALTREALRYVDEAPRDLQTAALLCAGLLATRVNEPAAAKQYLTQARDMAKADGNLTRLANILISLGNLAGDNAEFEDAETYYYDAMEVSRELGDDNRLNLCYLNLGVTLCDRGKYVEAIPWLEQCAALARSLGNESTEAYALSGLAIAIQGVGEFNRARELYAHALQMSRDQHNDLLVATCLSSLGELELCEARYEPARQYLRECLEICQENGYLRVSVRALAIVALLASRQGNREGAVQLLDALDSLLYTTGIPLLGGMQETYQLAREETATVSPAVDELGVAQRHVTPDAAGALALNLIADDRLPA